MKCISLGLPALSLCLLAFGCGGASLPEPEPADAPETLNEQTVGPDNKLRIDTFAPVGGATAYGPILTGYIAVSNIGTAPCSLAIPTAFGYYPKPDGTQGAVLFQVTSAGPLASPLAPSGVQYFIAQNTTANGQNAIYNGYFEIKVAGCPSEAVLTNNKATMVKQVIYNPL